MDHPEPISKRSIDIPQCRKGFSLDEARIFVDKVMEVFRHLDDMSDLRSMYETGKQLSRVYFDCHSIRTELAQQLTNSDYPAFASKMMKKLNNMGVFKNDDIWFSSFYFYNTTWNFSDTWPEFATALGLAGLPNLLNLNIGHQPYLENLGSKNVYYLIKASLSIIHNIAKVPGNTHYFGSDSVKHSLIQMAKREEEFLRCVSILCLAHLIQETEFDLVHSNGLDLLDSLLKYINLARLSEKRRCHGFQVCDLLGTLNAFVIHDQVKLKLLNLNSNMDQSQVMPDNSSVINNSNNGELNHDTNCLTWLKEIIELGMTLNVTNLALKEAEEAVKILWHLVFFLNSNLIGQKLLNWLNDIISTNHTTSTANNSITGLRRALESIKWQLNHMFKSNVQLNHVGVSASTQCGPILLCFAPSNRLIVSRIGDRLKDQNFPLTNYSLSNDDISFNEACAVGMSVLAANGSSQKQWLDIIGKASVLVVFMSDSFRLSPGCRLEVEHFIESNPEGYFRPIIPIVLQPKFKPTGWLSRLVQRTPIDFNGKRDPEASYEALIVQLREAYSEVKNYVDQMASATISTSGANAELRQSFAHVPDFNAMDGGAIPHLSGRNSTTGAPSHCNHNVHPMYDVAYPKVPMTNQRLLATNAWRYAIRPEVRTWSANKVSSWLKFRSFGHISSTIVGGIDGIMLSQLAGLRLWAPEYFNNCIRTEFGLGLAESLRFLEALDELAPEDDDDENHKYDTGNGVVNEDCLDRRSHVGSVDGAASRA